MGRTTTNNQLESSFRGLTEQSHDGSGCLQNSGGIAMSRMNGDLHHDNPTCVSNKKYDRMHVSCVISIYSHFYLSHRQAKKKRVFYLLSEPIRMSLITMSIHCQLMQAKSHIQ